MQQIVTKFGGTSVSSRCNWEHILSITQTHLNSGLQPIVVCSALTGASNKLEMMIVAALRNEHQSLQDELAKQYQHLARKLEVSPDLITEDIAQLTQWLTGIALLKEAPSKIHAQVLSLGELMMTRLGHAFLQQHGIHTQWFDARNALKTTAMASDERVNYLAARCQEESNPTLAKTFRESGFDVVITQGFIASNAAGETVLLGRGGSDTSGALFAAILQAKACEIWTDVPGIYTANPHQLPQARLLKQLNYDEAQEIASMGAKVLHPNCLPPVRRAGIPLFVKNTCMPTHPGTQVSKDSETDAPPIKAVLTKHQVTLISMDTLSMWQQVGFLAEVFHTFKQHGFSVDLLSSSESNVTVSLDSNAKLRDPKALDALLQDLNQFTRARVIGPCSAVSLVGQNIRTILSQLGPVLEVFDAKRVYLMSLASNDLNLTFVVDESQAEKLCQQLHALLIENHPQSAYYSTSWQEMFSPAQQRAIPWWEVEREPLLALGAAHSPCYIYHLPTVAEKAEALLGLKAIERLFYAIKANPHPDILKQLFEQGIGFECVSRQELEHVLKLFPNISKNRLLFTPNFASQSEYAFALCLDCHVTLDSLYPLEQWSELFRERSILLRIDPGVGMGHHKYVCTGGNESKFGIALADLDRVIELTTQAQIHVIGLHAHSGSGILSPGLWAQTASLLATTAARFPEVEILNLGGGLGVVDKPSQQPLELMQIDTELLAVKSQHPGFSFWLEPGRFFVAESGVILAKVTQVKTKGRVHFIGIETGMNSLLRPALYGAYHEIVNLTRLKSKQLDLAQVVGPICESGDVLGVSRMLPVSQEGDVILIANAGAYGHVMGSFYNLRAPAEERVLSY